MKAFKLLLRLAFVNLLRSKRRTFLLCSSLALGSAFIIFTLNMSSSTSKEITHEILNSYIGLFQVTHPDYYEQGKTKKFNFYKTLIPSDVSDLQSDTTTPRTTTGVFLAGNKKSAGAALIGIDPIKESQLNRLSKSVKEGEFFSHQNIKQILIGRRLARLLSLKVGEEVGLVGVSLDGSVANDMFLVVGLLDLGGGEIEEKMVFTRIQDARDFSSMPDGSFHQLVEFDTHASVVPDKRGFYKVTSWEKLLPSVARGLNFLSSFMFLISGLVVIVLSLGMANSLNITFIEREKELLGLNTIGMSLAMIIGSLLIEIFLLTFIGLSVGNFLGTLVSYYFHYYPLEASSLLNGKPIFIAGHLIHPTIRFAPDLGNNLKCTLLMTSFIITSFIYPLLRIKKRCSRVG
jgi:ABC-type lipoprotein release transport system permease subunit